MIARPSNQTLLIGVIAVAVVAAGLGYWGYSAHKHRELRAAVGAFLKDSSARMRDALGMETAPATVNRAQFVSKLNEHATIAERNLQLFKRLDLARDRPLTDAADDYLLTTREILKKQLDSHRHRLLLEESSQALVSHMRAGSRGSTWVQDAVKAKERVNKDYRSYNLATEAYGKLLETFPASQKKIAPHVDKTFLIEDGPIAEARRRALQEARQIASDMDRIRLPDALR